MRFQNTNLIVYASHSRLLQQTDAESIQAQ